MRRLVTRSLIAGAALGALILGVGGRLAMAGIAVANGSGPNFTIGGTLTVIGLGTVSGLAGSLIALPAHWAMRRLVPARSWPQHAVFALLLLLVTLRGLRGTGSAGLYWFIPLVAVYGTALAIFMARERRAVPSDAGASTPG